MEYIKELLLIVQHPLATLRKYKKDGLMLTVLCLFYLLLSAASIILIIQLVAVVSNAICGTYERNKEAVDYIASATLCVALAIAYKKSRKKPEPKKQDCALIDSEAAQYNYEVLRKVLFNILLEISDVVGVKCPTSLSELDTPNRFTSHGRIVFYNYVATKQKDVDPKAARQLLQNRINQKLHALEISGITQASVLFDGVAHPSIIVHNVSQTGVLIEIDMVLTNKVYCEYLRERKYQQWENTQYSTSARDKDF